MNYQEFLNELKTNKDCNFIARAITIHQANSIDAVISYLEERGVKLNGYVLICPHGITGRVISENTFVNNNPNIKYINYENDCMKCSIIESICVRFYPVFINLSKKVISKTDFYLAGTQLEFNWIYFLNRIFHDRNFKYIELEDGVGSYADHFKNKLDRIKFFQKINTKDYKYLFFYLKFCISYFKEYINTKIIEKKKNLIKATIFLCKKDGESTKLIRNERMIHHYQNVFKKIGSNIPKVKLKVFENSALINTQPLKSNNITDGIIDFEAYRKVIEILNRLNIPVTIKPHPRELDFKRYEEFNCNIFNDNTYTQEAILANLSCKPKCIISIFSSTLLNASGIYDIPAISLAKIILKKKINDVFREKLKDFINRYKDLFFFPETYEELSEYLSKLN